MKKDYIEIAGKRYRVESNWNALTAFLDAVGRDTLDELSRINTIRPSELTALMAACIEEGERLDGRDGAPSAKDLGAIITPDDVREFLTIYVRQSNPKLNQDEPKKEERETEPAS
jgi:hypothetical protein